MQSIEERKEYFKNYRETHKADIKAYEAERYKKNRERILARNKAWNAANKDRIAEVSREWDKENSERRKANGIRWRKENPDRDKAIWHRRQAKKRDGGGSFTAEEWFTLCFAVGFKCLCCGEKKPLTADHVVPVSKGGSSFMYNIQPLCLSCNAKKSDKIIDYRWEVQPWEEPECQPETTPSLAEAVSLAG